MYKEVRMLILNTYLSGSGIKFNIYIATGITKWFTTFAVRYTHSIEPHKLCSSYLSNWELLQRVSARQLVKVNKYDNISSNNA